MLNLLKGTAGNSMFGIIARYFRADNCMDAGGRATQDAKADDCMDAGGRATQDAKADDGSLCDINNNRPSKKITQRGREEWIFEGALKYHLLFTLVCCGFSAKVIAQSAVEIGPGLQVLTQIQGNWSNQCRRAGIRSEEGYRQDYLVVSYTHFDFIAKIYSDDTCGKQVTQWPAKYRFSLGDLVKLPNQEKAFLLHLVEESDPAEGWEISEHNLVHYKSGRLTLGREPLVSSGSSQLTSLNQELFFSRR